MKKEVSRLSSSRIEPLNSITGETNYFKDWLKNFEIFIFGKATPKTPFLTINVIIF